MLLDKHVGGRHFSPDQLMSESYHLLVEIEQAFQVCGMVVPEMVLHYIKKFQDIGASCRDRYLKREFLATIMPAEVEHEHDHSALPTPLPPLSRTRFQELDELSREVFGQGAGLGTILAPFFWLCQHCCKDKDCMLDHLVGLGLDGGWEFPTHLTAEVDPIGARYQAEFASGRSRPAAKAPPRQLDNALGSPKQRPKPASSRRASPKGWGDPPSPNANASPPSPGKALV